MPFFYGIAGSKMKVYDSMKGKKKTVITYKKWILYELVSIMKVPLKGVKGLAMTRSNKRRKVGPGRNK